MLKIKLVSAIFAAFIGIMIFIAFSSMQREQLDAAAKQNQLLELQELTTISERIQTTLNQSMQYVEFFDVLIQKDPAISQESLGDYTALVLKQNPSIHSISIAPGGIVARVYPLSGNEAAIGHNLLTDPKRSSFANAAIQKRRAIAQGPVESRQGGLLFFNRKAIFTTEAGKETLWGLVIVAVDFTGLLHDSGLFEDNDEYVFALRTDKADGTNDFTWGNQSLFSGSATIKTIQLADNRWEIAVGSKQSEELSQTPLKRMTLLFYFLLALVILLVYKHVFLFQQRSLAAKLDSLTRTLNKTAFESIVRNRLNNTINQHAIIMIDLNDFKKINDVYGHPAGDAVLVEVASRIRQVLRQSDQVSRLGGDEFIIFLESIANAAAVDQVIERLQKAMHDPVAWSEPIPVVLAIGQAYFPTDGDTFEKLYSVADERMYRMKKNGDDF